MRVSRMKKLDKERRHPVLGVEIRGLNLSADLSQDTIEAIRNTVEEEGVLVIPSQSLTDQQQVDFSRRFGDLERHPESEKRRVGHPETFYLTNVQADGELKDLIAPGTQRWHTDSSYREIPCTLSLLYAIDVPQQGGETEFVSTVHAYNQLPEDRRRGLEGVRVIHSYEHSNPDAWPKMSQEERDAVPPVSHPLVRTLDDGRRALYLGSHAARVEGLNEEEGRRLLVELLDLATREPFIYQHRWKKGDLLVWDNRLTLHRVRPYASTREKRVLRRTTVCGTERVR